MNVLLDTHVFLWLADERHKISAPALRIVDDPRTVLFLSVASIWEIGIKLPRGNLTIGIPLEELVSRAVDQDGVRVLPIDVRHIVTLARLPDHHRDPFDRMLVAQAQAEGLILVTADREIKRYGVPIAW